MGTGHKSSSGHGALLRLPFYQDLTEEQTRSIKASDKKPHLIATMGDDNQVTETNAVVQNIDTDSLQLSSMATKLSSLTSCLSAYTLRSKKRSVSFSDTIDYVLHNDSSDLYHTINSKQSKVNNRPKFGKKETTVYMTLFDDFCRHRTSATQATASINKCFQVSPELSVMRNQPSTLLGTTTNYSSSCTMSILHARDTDNRKGPEGMYCSDIYFFGRKKDDESKKYQKEKGAPSKSTKLAGTHQGVGTAKSSSHNTTAAQTQKKTGSSAGTSTTKAVCIKEPEKVEKPCPAASAGVCKGDVVATVSHIKIGPKEACPFHGKDPCRGPKCIVANSGGSEKVPIKITTVNNPRRGVFELVIRRISGAPLARNELMLEWTPPPTRPPSCSAPCPIICTPSGPCRPAKCKMIVCRPSSCKLKCCKSRCKKPCGPKPCRVMPCKNCCPSPCQPCPPSPCSGCRSCKPCKPPFPFKPSPCSPCSPCPPCKPKPCRPCKPCKPCKPGPSCKPDLTCPVGRTSIIFKPACKPKPCRSRCKPCPPCGPFKPPCSIPCISCFACISCSPCPPCKPCSPCKPRRPCGPAPCRKPRCKSRKPRPRCRPCPPPRCAPCGSCGPCTPCAPCPPLPCSTPSCKPSCSSPCFRSCPIGRKRTRRAHSQPKIRAHKKRISPCCNRLKSCPVVRCRSVPGCFDCCGFPPCPPLNCCSMPPCGPPRSCKSACSTCCG